MSELRNAYWRKTLTMSGIVLAAWVALTCAAALYPRELRDTAALLYAAIIAFYAWYVRKADRTLT